MGIPMSSTARSIGIFCNNVNAKSAVGAVWISQVFSESTEHKSVNISKKAMLSSTNIT